MFNHVIPDIDRYNSAMRKGLMDKIHFLDKVETDVIVDFGCADGSTLALINLIFPDKICIGYDISAAELAIAREKCPFAEFFSDWNELVDFVSGLPGKKTVVCNSLTHEVYAYGSAADINTFWQRVFCEIFDFVAFRDMMVSVTSTRPSDVISVNKIHMKYDQNRLREYESKWGSITENWSMIHFLLKYRYVENWEREVNENYLPVDLETFRRRIPDNFEPIYVEHFTHHFTRQQVKNDFGIDLVDRTHLKMVLQRK